MANSLRAKLSKLRHDRHITEEEYQAFIKKIDGHDKQIRTDAIEECKQILLSAIAEDGKTKCGKYIKSVNDMEKLKEQK